MIVRFIQAEKRRRDTSPRLLGVAGLTAGLTLLAKTEMGLAAVVTGIVAVALVAYPNMRLVLRSTAIFLGPAVLIVLAVYGYIASQVG